MFGINIDPGNEAAWAVSNPRTIRDAGFRGVRIVGRREIQPRIDQCRATNLEILNIITEQSKGYVYYNPTYVQIGNEPDLSNHADSMPPVAYAGYWNIYRGQFGYLKVPFFTAGLASGGQNAVDYLRAAWPHMAIKPDIIALHLYAKSPSAAADDLDMMWNEFGVPVATTEWSFTEQFISGEMENFQCMLGNKTDGRSTIWNSGFCWADAMVDGYGLVDSQGVPKETYFALLGWPDPNGCRI